MPSVALIYNSKSAQPVGWTKGRYPKYNEPQTWTFDIKGSGKDHFEPRYGFIQVITALNNIDDAFKQWATKNKPVNMESAEAGLEYIKKLKDAMEYHKKTGFYTQEAEKSQLAWREANYGPLGRCPCCRARISLDDEDFINRNFIIQAR